MRKQIAKDIAKERVGILIANALKETHANEKIASEQAYLARKIAMRLRVRLNYELRQLFCKKCKKFIIPGRDSRIRIAPLLRKQPSSCCIHWHVRFRPS